MSNSKCLGITRSGEACRGFVRPGETWCYAHHPRLSAQRKRAAAIGGTFKSKTLTEYREMKADLKQLYQDVKVGRVNRANAAVAAQIAGVWCKIAEAEIKQREFTEVTLVEFNEVRTKVEQLEEQAEAVRANGGQRWRA